jgi:1-acyl-sn-glycerol-3-phosphate acyltransferase
MQAGAVGLKRNKVLLIFPEGTRTIDGRLQEFKKGAAILAYEMGVPILPVGINGTFEVLPRLGGFKFHPIEIVFGKLIDPREFAGSADPYAALTDRLRNRVSNLKSSKEKSA